MTKADILSKCIKFTEIPILYGIYFLIKSNEIIYIGQSVNCHSRVRDHIRSGEIKIDYYLIYECRSDELDYLERKFINLFLPLYNQDSYTRKIKRDTIMAIIDGDDKQFNPLIKAISSPNKNSHKHIVMENEVNFIPRPLIEDCKK